MTLMDTINQSRQRVWAQQPPEFFEEAILDTDGTIVPSDSDAKQGWISPQGNTVTTRS